MRTGPWACAARRTACCLAVVVAFALLSCAPTAPAPPSASAKPAAGESTAAPSGSATWQAEWDRTLAGARHEAKVVVVGPPGQVYRDALMEFQKTYPDIAVEYSGITGRDFAPKLLAEREGGQYLWDVYVGGTGTVNGDLKPKGVLDPIRPTIIQPQVLDDSQWLGGFDAAFYDREQQYTFAFQASLSFPAWVNRDLVPEAELSRVEDTLDPRWRGKIIWQDPLVAGAGASTGGHLMMVLGDSFLQSLYTHDLALTRDNRQQVEAVVRGRYPVAFGVSGGQLVEFQNQGLGKNVRPLAPDTPAGARLSPGFGALALINRPPHPNATRVYVNWLLSREGQVAWARQVEDCSRRLDVGECPSENRPDSRRQYPPSINHEDYQHFQDEAVALAKQVIK
jgi:iron(III) transport system substrate-binding protein